MKVKIPTAVSFRETRVLRKMAEGKRVFELGALTGYSTIQMADVAEHVTTVDPHEK